MEEASEKSGNHLETLDYKSAGGTYYFDDEKDVWIFEEAESQIQNQGDAKGLVRKFVEKVGHNQKVIASPVIEEQTTSRLVELGIIPHVEKTQKVFVSRNKALFKTLKVARVLSGGGIQIEELKVEPNDPTIEADRDYPYQVDVSIIGRT